MARLPKLTFNDPATLSSNPIRPTGGGGRRPHLEAEGDGFSFAMDRAAENVVPHFVKDTPQNKKEALARERCTDYQDPLYARHYRGITPHDGYNFDDPSVTIIENPQWCKIFKK